MSRVKMNTIDELIELSRLLGTFGQIKRAVLLPNGEPETDSHHSFALALIAYELAQQYAPELEAKRILLYALVHDLPELITGDMITLTASAEELNQKAQADALAVEETAAQLTAAPYIVQALREYEGRVNDEALFVYWLDKMITIPTHFYDNGANLRQLGVHNQHDIQQWYERTLTKLRNQGGQPHPSAVTVLELAYQKMRDELLQP